MVRNHTLYCMQSDTLERLDAAYLLSIRLSMVLFTFLTSNLIFNFIKCFSNMSESIESLIRKFPIIWDKNDFNYRDRRLTQEAKLNLLSICNLRSETNYTLQWLNHKIRLFKNRLSYNQRKQSKLTHSSDINNNNNPNEDVLTDLNPIYYSEPFNTISIELENIIQNSTLFNENNQISDVQTLFDDFTIENASVDDTQGLDSDLLTQLNSPNLISFLVSSPNPDISCPTPSLSHNSPNTNVNDSLTSDPILSSQDDVVAIHIPDNAELTLDHLNLDEVE